ncbi:MAG: hypothetical protein U1E56_02755 [Bauldia sp.]
MNAIKGTILVAALLASAGAFAAVDGRTRQPLETPAQIYARCGVVLTDPNAIAGAAGAPCTTVAVYRLLEPVSGDN